MKKILIISTLMLNFLIACNNPIASTVEKEYNLIGITTSNSSTICNGCMNSSIIIIYNDNGDIKKVESSYPIKIIGNILTSTKNTVIIENNEIKNIKSNGGEVIQGEIVGYGMIGKYGDKLGLLATVDNKIQVYSTDESYLSKNLTSLIGSIAQIGTENRLLKIK